MPDFDISKLTPVQRSMKQKPTAAAKLMGVPPQYIYNWINKQGAPKYDTAVGPMVVIDELVAWRGNKGVSAPRARAEDGNMAGSKKSASSKAIKLDPIQQRRFEQERLDRQRGIYNTTFWKRGFKPVPFSFQSVIECLSNGDIHMRSVRNSIGMAIYQLEVSGADDELIGTLKEALELLSQTGYNESRGEEVELEAPPSEDPPTEEDDDDDDQVGPEET